MRRCAVYLLVLGSLAYAQAAATLSAFAANEAASEAVQPTVKSDAGALSDLPALPAGKATLLGGTISTVDHLRDRMVLQIFGGRRTVVTFDDRTHVYRDGKAASLDDLKSGERVYADTVLDGTKIFARNVRVATGSALGQSSGQVVSFDPANGELAFRDTISLIPWRMRLTHDTVILRGDRPALPAELCPGTLVTVAFLTGGDGRAMVRQISILASPGTAFVFAGTSRIS